MASTIKIKNGTSGAPSSLAQGELAMDVSIGKLFHGTTGGTAVSSSFTFTEVTASGNISASGDIIGANVLVPTDGLIANSDNTSQNIKFESTSELEINSSTVTIDAAVVNFDSSTGDITFKDSNVSLNSPL